MTQIYVEINPKGFKKVTCDEGYYITDYFEGMDIILFSDSTLMFTPLSVDVENTYRVIDEQEHQRLTQLYSEAVEAENGN